MPSLISQIHAARSEMLSGHASEALNWLRSIDVSFATLSIVRGECQYVLGNWKESVKEFELALRLSPNTPRADMLLILSQEMLDLERMMRPAPTISRVKQEAVQPEIFKSETPAPAVVPAQDEIGLVSETLAELMIKQGKPDEARKVFIQLARLNPDRYEYFRERMAALNR